MVDAGPIGSYLLPKTGDQAKEAAALDFVRYVTGPGYPGYIEASGTFPIVNGAGINSNEHFAVAFDSTSVMLTVESGK